MKRATASAPSKVILFGEHAVVYGRGAVVCAIDLRTRVDIRPSEKIIVRAPLRPNRAEFLWERGTLVPKRKAEEYAYVRRALENVMALHGPPHGVQVDISTEAPIGAGLGSSSSAIVATIAAASAFLGMTLSLDEIRELAHRTEREVQGASSGTDVAVAALGGLLFFRGGIHERLPPHNLPLWIGFTGHAGSTTELVAGVRRLCERHPEVTGSLFNAIDGISQEARRNLAGRPDVGLLGELMDMNQGALQSLGVSSPKLEKLIGACRRAGAHGAKLTGAGGGGCMVALGQALEDAIRKAGGIPIKARMTEEGVRVKTF